MKNKVLLGLGVFALMFTIYQSTAKSVNESGTYHEAKVIGSITLGDKQITTVLI